MKSITLHKLDPEVAQALEKEARDANQSLNRTAQALLRRVLGLDPEARDNRSDDFRDLFGQWSAEDLAEFNERTGDLKQIDPADWEN